MYDSTRKGSKKVEENGFFRLRIDISDSTHFPNARMSDFNTRCENSDTRMNISYARGARHDDD